MKNVYRILGFLFGVSLLSGLALAQDLLAPAEVTGEVVYIPFPVEITVDGKVDDWASVPHVTVDRGSMTSSIEGENTAFDLAVAADETTLYLTMSSVDQNIVTGQHESNFWNEDSLEFYLILLGALPKSMTRMSSQVNINPGDIGNTDATALPSQAQTASIAA